MTWKRWYVVKYIKKVDVNLASLLLLLVLSIFVSRYHANANMCDVVSTLAWISPEDDTNSNEKRLGYRMN